MQEKFDESNPRVQLAVLAQDRFRYSEVDDDGWPGMDRDLAPLLSPDTELGQAVLEIWSRRLYNLNVDFTSLFPGFDSLVRKNYHALEMMQSIAGEQSSVVRGFTDKLIMLGYMHRAKVFPEHIESYGKALAFALRYTHGERFTDPDLEALAFLYSYCVRFVLEGAKKGLAAVLGLERDGDILMRTGRIPDTVWPEQVGAHARLGKGGPG